MGTLIVFEGGEGAGKSTQASLVYDRLSGEGFNCVLTREPGGTPLGEAVRQWLKKRSGLTPLSELLLFTAARALLVEQVIGPAMNAGKIVICDRFAASTVAYQGYGRGLDMGLIDLLNAESTRGIKPDLTLLLDMPIDTGLGRKGSRELDTFESEANEFHHRVRDGYLAQASRNPDTWLMIDSTQPKNTISAQVWDRVQTLLRLSVD